MPKRIAAGAAIASVMATSGAVVTDRQINPYEDRGAHYELPITSDIPQGERIEIAKDYAAMTVKGWNDEYAITIEPQIPATKVIGSAVGEYWATSDGRMFAEDERAFTARADRALFSKRMEYKDGDVTAFIEPLSDTEFDIDFTLDSEPDTNVFEYRITGAEDFDFFYQPPLTQGEIDEGAERPENVVGSYAVYHKTKANHRTGSTNYATGKVMHIYRPKAIDANGKEEWAELKYENGVLSVTVPQTFLDEAVYPVRVDPTFGQTNIGGSHTFAIAFAGYYIRRGNGGSNATPASAGTLDSMSVAMNLSTGSETGSVFVALNTENTTTDSHAEVFSTIEDKTVDTTPTFYTFTADSSSITAVAYVLSVVGDDGDFTAALRISGDNTGVDNEYLEASGSFAAAQEDPWTETDALGFRFSIYATYTASGGGAAAPAPTQDVIWFD